MSPLVAAILKVLIAESPDIILWILRQAGIVDADESHVERVRKSVDDYMPSNPMLAIKRKRYVDPTIGDTSNPYEDE